MEKTIAIKTTIIGLALIVFLEFLFIELELFQYAPNIGVLFHLCGGFLVGILAYYIFQHSLIQTEWYVTFIFIIGTVCLAAVGWETFEWVLGKITGSLYQVDLDNTMEDMIVGLSGGIIACPIVLIRNMYIAKTINETIHTQNMDVERRMSA